MTQPTEMPMTMAGKVASPLRAFLSTESASARVLVGAVVLALVWANLTPAGYETFWTSVLPVRVGPLALSLDLRTWVNSGLMTDRKSVV